MRSLLALAITLPALAASARAAQCTVGTLIASDAGENDLFGALSLSISGPAVLVGKTEDDDLGPSAGAAYLFQQSGPAFVQTAKLEAQDGEAGDQLGRALALAGGEALVGAPGDDDGGAGAGAAYLFADGPLGWVQVDKLRAGDPFPFDAFGTALALEGDTLVVGAPQAQLIGPSGPGAVYVFERGAAGFVQSAKLVASDAAFGDSFGFSVALAGDLLVIGAPTASPAGLQSGTAYAFERTPSGWVETAKLTPLSAGVGALFGFAVSASGDAVLVGAPGAAVGPSAGAGRAFVFERGAQGFAETAALNGSTGQIGPHDSFGLAVALAGARAVIGAPLDDDAFAGPDAGLAYEFENGPSGWALKQLLRSPAQSPTDLYGRTVAASAGLFAIGAPLEDGPASNAGRVFVYTGFAPASALAFGCASPPGSLTVAQPPRIASSLTLRVDNPLGTQASGAFSFVALGPVPAPGFPCGVSAPGLGMAGPGAPGEILIDLSIGFTLLSGPVWAGPGSPASTSTFIPGKCSLIGKRVYAQGALLDLAAAQGVELALTEGLELTIGP